VQRLGLEVDMVGVRDPERQQWELYLGGVDKVRSVLQKMDATPGK